MRFFLFLLLAIHSATALAQINITDNATQVSDFSLPYYYSENYRLDINDVQYLNFEKETGNQFSFGYLDGETWFKFQINNQSSNDKFVLTFSESFMHVYEFYSFDGAHWNKKDMSLFVPLEQRDMRDNRPAVRFDVPMGETHTYYVRIDTFFSQMGAFKIYNEAYYLTQHKDIQALSYMFYFGSMIIIIFLSLLLYITLKEKIYFWYANYISFFLLFIIVFSGYDLYLGYPQWHDQLNAAAAMSMGFFILFSNLLLNTKQYIPKTCQLLKILAVVFFILAALIILKPQPWFEVTHILSSVSFMILLYAAMRSWIYGNAKSGYYFAIMLVMISSLMLLLLMNLGLLENNFINRYGFIFVSFFEITAFSFVLSQEVFEEREEKISLQDAFIKIKSSHEKQLKEKIKERTNDLLKKSRELQGSKMALEAQVDKDVMTGVYNRQYFNRMSDELFDRAIDQQTTLSILIVDIDNFKQINDAYGSLVGDKVIAAVAKILMKNTRMQDTVARYGGDEFAVLLPDTQLEEAFTSANNIKTRIEKVIIPIKDDGENFSQITVTASLGVSQAERMFDNSIDAAIVRADQAISQAKAQGKNQVERCEI